MIKNYISLTKPGIIFGNIIATASGFLLASQGDINFYQFFIILIATALIIGCGCGYNNVIDRDIDPKMSRTKNRVIASGKISIYNALIFSTVLGILGFGMLIIFSNWLTVFFGALGIVVYVGFYSLKYKRSSIHGTLIGSLSGACPPVMGYISVTSHFDIGAAILLIAFALWQIPHSYAIAIYRFEDYKAANIPVLPIKQGVNSARKHIIIYIIGFGLATLMLGYYDYVGHLYSLVMACFSLYWLYLAKTGFKPETQKVWARKLFVFSIVIMMTFSVLISIDFTHNTELKTLSSLFVSK